MSADCVTSRPLAALPKAELAFDVGGEAPGRVGEAADAPVMINLSIHDRLESVEAEWRRFERTADCTPFQTFDWLLRWQRHIGTRTGVQPAIAVGTFAEGQSAFIFPLGIDRSRGARRLCWLGQDLNDYNAPLIAREFSERIPADQFCAVWKELRTLMQRERLFRHDWIELEKMPQLVGGQVNPFFALALATNPSGAHFAQLGDDWKKFYAAKRSSATRRRDRSKRKHMAQFGAIDFAIDTSAADAQLTLEALMAQKRRLFAHRGIPDMFERPGWREFFLDLAERAEPLRASPLARDGKVQLHVGHTQFGSIRGATHLGVIFRDAYFHVLSSYDDGPLAHYGPGALHLRELIANVIGLGLRRFDFTVGDEPYKLEWSDTHIKLGDYAAAATWHGAAAWGRSTAHRRIKRLIKQTPVAWRMVTRLRAKFGPLLQRPQSPVVKLALVSDIHANLPALNAVLDDIAVVGADRIVCLGDIVGYNTQPAECIAAIRRHDALCVAGNHDLAVCGRITTRSFSRAAARAVAWTQRCLGRDDLSYLSSLPLKAVIGGQLIAVHGALHPQADCATVRLDSDERRLQSFQALMADPSGPRICAFGHTHHVGVYRYRNGRAVTLPDTKISLRDDAYYLINPGTVGQPRERDRRASYMIVDLRERTVSVQRVRYDLSASLAATRRAGLAPALSFVPAPVRLSVATGLRALRLDGPVRQFVGLLGL